MLVISHILSLVVSNIGSYSNTAKINFNDTEERGLLPFKIFLEEVLSFGCRNTGAINDSYKPSSAVYHILSCWW